LARTFASVPPSSIRPILDEVERGLLVASQQRRHLDRVEHRVVRHRRKLRILPLGA
jgi:hypothetical protein